MSLAVFPTNLTNAEWRLPEPLVPAPKFAGRPAKYLRREIDNAIQYLLRTGCAWRLLPHGLPPGQLAYQYVWVWRRGETWQQIHDALFVRVRQATRAGGMCVGPHTVCSGISWIASGPTSKIALLQASSTPAA